MKAKYWAYVSKDGYVNIRIYTNDPRVKQAFDDCLGFDNRIVAIIAPFESDDIYSARQHIQKIFEAKMGS